MNNGEAAVKRIANFTICKLTLKNSLDAGTLREDEYERAVEHAAGRYQIDPMTGIALEPAKGSIGSMLKFWTG